MEVGCTNSQSIVTADDILVHPRFEGAKRAHLISLTGLFLGDRETTRLMVNAGTITLRALLVGFHANHNEYDRTTWATVGRVQDLIVMRGLASRRRLDDLISRFRQVGYIDYEHRSADGRSRLLRPTQRLLEHDRAHLLVYHRFLNELYPGKGYDWEDAETHLTIRRIAFHHLNQAMAFMGHPVLMTLLARDAGFLAFIVLAEAELQRRGDELSFSSLATRLGVSRTHVRNLFVEAEQMGLVNLVGTRKRTVRIMPELWQAYDRFLADVHAGQHAIAQLAFQTMGRM